MKTFPIKKAPRLSLAGVKQFRGMDGHGLNADLYLDGKKVASLLDEGCGGEMISHWADNYHEHRSALAKCVNDYIASLGLPDEVSDVGDGEFTMKQDLTALVNEAIDDMENAKRLRRLAKANVLFKLPSQKAGEFYTMKHLGKPEAARAAVLKKHPEAQFIDPEAA